MANNGKPLVLVPACNRMLGAHPFHIVGKKYIDAVRLADATPLVVPWASADEIGPLLALADGVLLTGSPSNVHPGRYGAERAAPDLLHDEARDDWTLRLIPAVLERGIPLLAICRGTQETNVALGGSLHQQVQAVNGYADHRARDADPVEVQYGPAHAVQIEPGGVLAGLLGGATTIEVNSIHQQAVDRLAPGLRVEARAPDGLIEAFSAPAAPGFNLCVQWHPEWQAAANPISMKLLAAFGAACRSYRLERIARFPEFQ
jgi:putative glutamine amidotransferase